MPLLGKLIGSYCRFFAGEVGPHVLSEQRLLAACVPAGAAVADIGGGDGKLAGELAQAARFVIIVDKETTSLPGADTRQYTGALSRALRRGDRQRISPVQGDAGALPIAPGALDALVSSQLLEHLDDSEKSRFFREAARTLKPGGLLAISTPDGDYFRSHRVWVPDLVRAVIPRRRLQQLPDPLCGAWLKQTVQEWERSVGHYDRGCCLESVRAIAAREGLDYVSHRYIHTALTFFWLQVMFTIPLIWIGALPLVRLLYEIESRLPFRSGANFLIIFRNAAGQPMTRQAHA
jgi:SAM-dependent methyltransferase